ncbi:MAG TPA: tryptophan 2,3-dioxygenase family protein [Chloroflexaceae bacterium]|nr:tryptophan 2,3-dioxygenase family protein [Chloroflexaceae bacterium]
MAHALTYGSYLRLDELLALQTPRSSAAGEPEHDELLFIVIHQVYELWFKQLLHELDYAALRLREGDTARGSHTLGRVRSILKTVVAQVDVLETMTPLEFNAFRGHLDAASGFQSAQFRAIEFMLGHKRANMLRHFAGDEAAHALLAARYEAPTLWDAFLHYLSRGGYPVPPDELRRDVREPLAPSPAVQAILVELYRRDPAARNVCERLVDMDEGFQEWRYRHVKMVERTIGMKAGTGGSPGAAYLATTLKPFFPDLWAIRSLL